jgi:putative peptidoglycan lipid II flippase
MFMVGVALPFALAARAARGDTWGSQARHALRRAAMLVLIGVLLDHVGADRVQIGFMRVLQQIAVRAFYARGDTFRPMVLGTVICLGAIPVYLGLGPRWGAAGLAAAGVLAMSTNTLGTLLLARRLHGAPNLGALALSGARAAVIAGIAAYAGAKTLRGGEGTAGILTDLGFGFAAYGAITLALVFLLGDAPLRDAIRRLVRRLTPGRPRPPDPPA